MQSPEKRRKDLLILAQPLVNCCNFIELSPLKKPFLYIKIHRNETLFDIKQPCYLVGIFSGLSYRKLDTQ